MRAKDWMTREVRTCRPETSLNDAAYRMWAHDCGCLPVVDAEGRPVGMITDRDLCMGACLNGKSLKDLRVADSMTRSVSSCRSSAPIEEVIRCMADHQVRRVPLVDTRGRIEGILSVNDLTRRMVALGEKERGRLAPRLLEALASIAETRVGDVPEAVEVTSTEPATVA